MSSDHALALGPWQVLDVGSIWMKEFAAALAGTVPMVAWSPVMSLTGLVQQQEQEELLREPALRIRRYPLQRGYARTPVRQLLPFQIALLKRLRAHSREESRTALICTTPFYAPVAEHWAGPVVYYVTDLTAGYASLNEDQVKALDKRMCKVATAVCANSQRLARYLQNEAASTLPESRLTCRRTPAATPRRSRLCRMLPAPATLPPRRCSSPNRCRGISRICNGRLPG